MQAGFLFDANKCVGCHACAVACAIENHLQPEMNWRQILTFNPAGIAGIPHFHLSMACNHCERAVCMEQCPAQAIRKDAATGAVLINGKQCIGCHFCSWVCPYDAPTFDHTENVMTKCTFCSPRLQEGLKPACVTVCPTDALEFDYFEPPVGTPDFPGFPESGIRPSIKITALRSNGTTAQQFSQPYSKDILSEFIGAKNNLPAKISLQKEWALVVFTLLVAILVGLFSAAFLGGVSLNPFIFAGGGAAGMALSTVHLGKRHRAFRAVLNWRSSWLSREIFCFSLFIAGATVFLLFKQFLWLGYISLGLGFTAAFCVDMVYKVTASVKKEALHSSQILLSVLFFSAFFNHFFPGVVFLASLKLFLYLNRKRKDMPKESRSFSFVAVRLVSGLILPPTLLLIDDRAFFASALILMLIGECIDRAEFYGELDILTPVKHTSVKFKKLFRLTYSILTITFFALA